jgi:hypothetical protein
MFFYGHGPGCQVTLLREFLDGSRVYWCATCQTSITVQYIIGSSTTAHYRVGTSINLQPTPTREPVPRAFYKAFEGDDKAGVVL